MYQSQNNAHYFPSLSLLLSITKMEIPKNTPCLKNSIVYGFLFLQFDIRSPPFNQNLTHKN